MVVRDIPPYSIAVGDPARVIRQRFPDSTIEILQLIRWWDWPLQTVGENIDLLTAELDDTTLNELLQVYKSLSIHAKKDL